MIGKILPDKRQKSLMVTYISCGIVRAKTARGGISRNFWFQDETGNTNTERSNRFSGFSCEIVLTLRALRILYPYIIPNCSITLRYQ